MSELKNWERDARNLSNGPVAIYGDYNSKRITSQQGTFTMFGGTERDMARSEASTPAAEQVLSKIAISGASHIKIFHDLRQFGFTDTHLYPDMNGISKDITNMIGGET